MEDYNKWGVSRIWKEAVVGYSMVDDSGFRPDIEEKRTRIYDGYLLNRYTCLERYHCITIQLL
jgi:hypothetical protein